MKLDPKDSPKDVRRIAAEASCDPRTVHRYLSGGTVRELCRERIEQALRALGFTARRARVRGAA